MATFYGTMRSNYFHVKNEEDFRAFIEKCQSDDGKLPLFERKTDDGKTLFGFGCYSSAISGIEGYTSDKNDDSGAEYVECIEEEFYDILQSMVAEDDAIIIMSAGHEKLCYISAWALIITAKEINCVDLTNMAVSKAAELLGNKAWTTSCEY